MYNRKFYHVIISLLMLAGLNRPAFADEIQLQKNHPDRYVVVKGDTLWDISGKFLKDPWQWPQVWKMNRAEIKNPHWIYPGDVIVLDTSSGTPQLKLLPQTITLEPGVIVEPLEQDAIKSISPNIITPFLTEPLLIENNQLGDAPRIIAGPDNRLVLSPGSKVYINKLAEEQGTHWSIYRPGQPLTNPETNELLGTEAIYLGDLDVSRFGEPATAKIARAKEEIFAKDRLIAATDEFQSNFIPHAPETQVRGRILRVYGGVAEAGPESIVSISLGKNDGLEPGHVLEVSRSGRIILDTEAAKQKTQKAEDKKSGLKPGEVRLPDERIGLLMVFRTFDRVSYALIMSASDSIHTLDAVKTP